MNQNTKIKAEKLSQKPKKERKSVKQIITHPYLINGVAFFIFTITVLYWTVLHNSPFIFKVQKLSLFVPSRLFFVDTMQTPAGFLTYVGLFLTQFFYKPWLGALIFLFLLLLVGHLVKLSFRTTGKLLPLSFIPPLLLLLVFSQLGYYIYANKSPGIAYANIIGTIFTLLGYYGYKCISSGKLKLCFALFFIIVGYPFAGFYAILGGGLMALSILIQAFQHQTVKFYDSLLVLVCAVVIPLIYYRFVYVHLNVVNIYSVGITLPAFSLSQNLAWSLPLILLVIVLVFFTLFSEIEKEIIIPIVSKQTRFVVVALFLGITVYVFGASYNDANFRAEIEMSEAMENNDWRGVLRIRKQVEEEPTRMVVILTNLALQKLNLAGDRMFKFRNGDRFYDTPITMSSMLINGVPIYYEYGKVNYSYRWAMETSVSYSWYVENIQYMVKVAIINKEYALAKKYNDVLMQTRYYKVWAKQHQSYIDNPESVNEMPGYKDIMKLMDYSNTIGSDNASLENYLLYSMADLNDGTTEMLEISIQSCLILKQLDKFLPRLKYYAQNRKRVPLHYQEAALLFDFVEKKINIEGIPIEESTRERFASFVNLNTKMQNMPEEKIKEVFGKSFGDTYWYYYFLMNDIKIDGGKNTEKWKVDR